MAASAEVGEAFVRIRPDTTGFARELDRRADPAIRRVERSLGRSNRELARFGRGTLVGTGALRELGRAAAFASLSFVGGAGLVVGIRSAINAAQDAEVAQRLLARTLEQQNISFDENREAIDRRVTALSQMAGIDDELVTRTFTAFVRRTGDVTKALNQTAIAADVARGREISLEAATGLVTRASLGMAGALRRAGIEVEKNATATELLASLQEKFAGQAQAFGETSAGAQERFAVALENTQEIIGQALLPTLTDLLNRGTEWLEDAENQRRIQELVNDVLEKGEKIVRGFVNAVDAISDVARPAIKLVGDLEDAVTLLIEAMVVGKVLRFVGALGGAGAAGGAAGGFAAGTAAGGLAGAAGTAARRVDVLRLALRRLPAVVAVTLAFDLVVRRDDSAIGDAITGFLGDDATTAAVFGENGSPFPKGSPLDQQWQRDFKRGFDRFRDGIEDLRISPPQFTLPGQISGTAIAGRPQTLIERLRNAVSAALLTPGTEDDVRALKAQRDQTQKALNFALEQIRLGKGDTEFFSEQVDQLTGDIASITADLANIAEENAAKAAEARERFIEALIPDAVRGRGLAEGAFARFQQATAGQIGAIVGRTFRAQVARPDLTQFLGADPLRSLETQIAEQRFEDEEDLLPFLNRELQSVNERLRLLRKLGATREEILQQTLAQATLKRRIRDIREQDEDAERINIFAEAAEEFRRFGGNIGGILSPADARGLVAGEILARQPAGGGAVAAAAGAAAKGALAGATIVQNFFGAKEPAQALQSASQAARALR